MLKCARVFVHLARRRDLLPQMQFPSRGAAISDAMQRPRCQSPDVFSHYSILARALTHLETNLCERGSRGNWQVWKCVEASIFRIVVVLTDRHSTFAAEKAMTKGKEESERERERALEQLSSRYSAADCSSACSFVFFRLHGPAAVPKGACTYDVRVAEGGSPKKD